MDSEQGTNFRSFHPQNRIGGTECISARGGDSARRKAKGYTELELTRQGAELPEGWLVKEKAKHAFVIARRQLDICDGKVRCAAK